jgi:hypothetical protein
MIFRVNFLLAVGVLATLAFYLVGRFLIVGPVSLVKPEWAGYVAGVVILAALMLIVQALAKVMDRLQSLTNAARSARDLRIGTMGISAQGAITAGHLATAYGVYGYFAADAGSTPLLSMALAVFLYAAGAVSALSDWRRQAGNPAGDR